MELTCTCTFPESNVVHRTTEQCTREGVAAGLGGCLSPLDHHEFRPAALVGLTANDVHIILNALEVWYGQTKNANTGMLLRRMAEAGSE